MSDISKLGLLIRQFRDEKKITQEQLADLSGLSRVQIARLETGARGGGANLSYATITGLAGAFGVTTEEFMKKIANDEPANFTKAAKETASSKKQTKLKPKKPK